MEPKPVKRGIAFSGGGSRGQFHVGVARLLIGELNIDYQVYAGVSVGALVASLLSQYKAGEEASAYEELERLFSSVRTKDIWRHWFPFRQLSLWKGSLLDSSPLRKMVNEHVDVARLIGSGKQFRCSAVSMNRLKSRTFTEHDQRIKDGIAASASVPLFFQPVEIDGEWWADGCIRETTPIKACIEAGCDEIDLIVCHPEVHVVSGKPSTSQSLARSLEAMSDEIVWSDYKMAIAYNKLACSDGTKRVVKIRVFSPSSSLNDDALRFDPDEASAIQLEGYRVACEVVAATKQSTKQSERE